MSANKTTTRSFSVLTIITLFEKVIAFVFEAIIAATLGASLVTDAYFTAAEFFTLIDSAFLSSLTVVALNRFSHHLNSEDESKAFGALSNLLSCYFPIMLVIAGTILLLANPISYLIAPGYSTETRAVLIRCIRVMTVVPLIVCVISIELAILRQKKSFGITGLKSLFISVVGIVSLILFGHKDVKNADVLSVAFIFSLLCYGILTTYCVSKHGKLRFCKPSFNTEVKETFKMILPLTVSYGISNLSLMVGKITASMLGDGYVSSLTYAHSLYRVVTAVFITNLSTILLTDFNELFAKEKCDAIATKIKSVVSVMTMLLLPITIISVVCSSDVVKIVYERGSFNANSTQLVGSVLLVYAINFIPAMIQGLYNQVLYAKGDTKSPMWIALISIVINFGVSFATINIIGLPGVAIGTVVSSVISVFMCRYVVKRHLPVFQGCYSFRFILNCIISGTICFCAVLFVKQFHFSAFLTFLFATIAGGGAFVGTMLLLRDTTAMGMVKRGMGLLKHKNKKMSV